MMEVKELINKLQNCNNPDVQVLVCDVDDNEIFEITFVDNDSGDKVELNFNSEGEEEKPDTSIYGLTQQYGHLIVEVVTTSPTRDRLATIKYSMANEFMRWVQEDKNPTAFFIDGGGEGHHLGDTYTGLDFLISEKLKESLNKSGWVLYGDLLPDGDGYVSSLLKDQNHSHHSFNKGGKKTKSLK
jgi:hypothetical protein